MSILIVVVFPAPFGPRRPNSSPSSIAKLTPRTASTSSERRRNVPVVVRYVRWRSIASTTAGTGLHASDVACEPRGGNPHPPRVPLTCHRVACGAGLCGATSGGDGRLTLGYPQGGQGMKVRGLAVLALAALGAAALAATAG